MNKNSKVLALKYRPKVFEDLIGQDIVAETIFNSIKTDKIPNAYLFTGIRGVGKTTTARIIAKALNCSRGIKNLCKENLCENCNSITDSNHIDVLEMDAASKTGVDDVRDLIEFSRYGPTTAKYKIFIIDEVHMLSKQAFNALLKTLEEPPEYLKFIFATTEIKKIPITVISRCQRFDLSRVKSVELFTFIKKIKEKENGKISDEALKLIVKISEGSVRDALSLLDRGLINLFKLIFDGKEKEVLIMYRAIYDQGIEPKTFINEFLELLYYFKNIESLELDSANFLLNDDEFKIIKETAQNIKSETLILFWQFTIDTLEELDIVSNQNLTIEMFLIRLIYLKGISNISKIIDNNTIPEKVELEKNDKESIQKVLNKNNDLPDLKNQTVGQIKNIIQETPQEQNSKEMTNSNIINSFDNLIDYCFEKKEIKLKYELEKNVNLVSFENQRIEISFNDALDKDFIKNLSSKLNEWTGDRWLITLSQKKGEPSKKQKKIDIKKKLLVESKKSFIYKEVLENFHDAELVDLDVGDKSND